MYIESDLHKFIKLLRDIGIEYTPRDLLDGTTEVCVREDSKCAVVVVFDTLTGNFKEFDSY